MAGQAIGVGEPRHTPHHGDRRHRRQAGGIGAARSHSPPQHCGRQERDSHPAVLETHRRQRGDAEAGDEVVAVDKETPETGADKAEPGEKPDSAKEHAIDQKTAYSVEIRKGDGTTVDVALDDAFNVLASEQDNEQGTESSSEQAAETPAQR